MSRRAEFILISCTPPQRSANTSADSHESPIVMVSRCAYGCNRNCNARRVLAPDLLSQIGRYFEKLRTCTILCRARHAPRFVRLGAVGHRRRVQPGAGHVTSSRGDCNALRSAQAMPALIRESRTAMHDPSCLRTQQELSVICHMPATIARQ